MLLKNHKSIRIDPHDAHAVEWGLCSFDNPLLAGLLAAQLNAGDGRLMGFVAVIDKLVDDFPDDDEAILLLLAQMASIAIENLQSADARAANKAKDQFLAVLSHELRTPLTPVLATLSSLTPDNRVPADMQNDLEMIRRNVELEARLIDDLLDLTRISKGKIELQFGAVDAHSLIVDAMNICQVDIQAKSQKVSAKLEAAHSYVLGDPTRLHQVLWNLLKNAVKFTGPGGSIEVSSENAADGSLIIRVSDTGIGIEPEILPRIFNAFEQGKRSITRQFGGLGLGLTITKALVDAHHGSITAASDGGNKGATFVLTLPLDKSHRKPAAFTGPMPPSAPARRLRILLVEDHPDTGRVMSKLLTKEMHQVRLAKNTADAVRAYESDAFDLVISDIGLPDGSGLDLMKTLQAKRAVTAIALSGFGMEEDVRRSREAGFHEHLTKPINFPKLLDCIERVAASAADRVAQPMDLSA